MGEEKRHSLRFDGRTDSGGLAGGSLGFRHLSNSASSFQICLWTHHRNHPILPGWRKWRDSSLGALAGRASWRAVGLVGFRHPPMLKLKVLGCATLQLSLALELEAGV